MRLKRFIVIGLERLCTLIDRAPAIWWVHGRPHFHKSGGLLGCSIGLSNLSMRLDERWKTKIWEVIENG